MIINKSKLGFTLIELIVVIGIFGILAVIASNFLLSTVSTNNRTIVENDVRQNVSLVMTDIATHLRKSGCVHFDGVSTLTVSESRKDDVNNCSGGTTSVRFVVDVNGVLTKSVAGGSYNVVSSDGVVFCQTGNACGGNTGCAPGLKLSNVGSPTPVSGITTEAVDVVVSARQKNPTVRRDSCVAITLTETVTPRNAGN